MIDYYPCATAVGVFVLLISMLVSQVYEGVDQRSDERVAIKAMNRHEIDDNPRLVTLLEREINISLKLTHTGVTVMHAILNHVSVLGACLRVSN